MHKHLGLLFWLILFAGAMHAQSGQQRSKAEAEGADLFRQHCAACHGNDGSGGERAPNITTQHDVVAASDAQLKEIVSKGIPEAGMPSFDYLGGEKVGNLVVWLRVLQGVGGTTHAALPGDPASGEAIFFGKAECSKCHMVLGKGGFIAQDLTAYARGRSVRAIRASIVKPGSSPGEGEHLTRVIMANGTKYEGVIRAEDNFAIVLQNEEGEFQSIERDHIVKLESGQPLMPQDYGKTLTEQELNDVVSYLIKAAMPIKPMRISQNEKE